MLCLRATLPAVVTILLSLASQLFRSADALASGAPSLACSSMTPMHFAVHAKPLDTCPFTVRQSKLRYRSGEDDIVTVTLAVKIASQNRTFRGFLIKAINPVTKHPIGQFREQDDVNLRPRCHGATHVSADDKSQVVLHWTPDDANEEDNRVVFETTFVENFRTFFVGVKSTYQGRPAEEAADEDEGSSHATDASSETTKAMSEKDNETNGNQWNKAKSGKTKMNSFWFD